MTCTQEYLDDAIEIALNDEGIQATDEQIKNISGSVMVSLENYGTFSGRDTIPNPLEAVIRVNETNHKRTVKNMDAAYTKEIEELKRIIARLRTRIWELSNGT